MRYNLDQKTFRSVANSSNGDVDGETVFKYNQKGSLVWADYKGGSVVRGHLIATMAIDGRLQMHYHHLNELGELMAGVCESVPEILPDGRLKFKEKWQWSTGDLSEGESEIIEIDTG